MASPARAGLLILLFSSFLSFSSSSLHHASGVAEQQGEFGYFVLSLLWPGTLCRRDLPCCPSNGCCNSSLLLNEFTIHGLWPNYNDGTWPACCSQSYFDINQVSSLIWTLEKYWPTLSCNASSNCHGGEGLFWGHEWEKHGTCSFPVIQDEYSYFSTTLDLYFKYNITKVLEGAGFLATNSERYPLDDIITTIKNAVGASPLLVCSDGAVEELRLCFYRDFKPRNCILGFDGLDGVLNSTSSCPRYVKLPKYIPSVFDIENASPYMVAQR